MFYVNCVLWFLVNSLTRLIKLMVQRGSFIYLYLVSNKYTFPCIYLFLISVIFIIYYYYVNHIQTW